MTELYDRIFAFDVSPPFSAFHLIGNEQIVQRLNGFGPDQLVDFITFLIQ